MKKLVFALVFCGVWGGGLASANQRWVDADVGCYHDDSIDAINNEKLGFTRPQGPWAGPIVLPDPADCRQGPNVSVVEGNVSINGQLIYDNGWRDAAVEVRTSPTGAVVIRTDEGNLLRYLPGKGLETWFDGSVDTVEEFRMSRTGEIVGRTKDDQLVINKRVYSTVETVAKLFASSGGAVGALLDDGSIVNSLGFEYDEPTDPVEQVKVARDGTVFFLTHDGELWSGRNGRARVIYDDHTDPISVFKINGDGVAAYLTSEGKLGRNGQWLVDGDFEVDEFWVQTSGAIRVKDVEGGVHVLR